MHKANHCYLYKQCLKALSSCDALAKYHNANLIQKTQIIGGLISELSRGQKELMQSIEQNIYDYAAYQIHSKMFDVIISSVTCEREHFKGFFYLSFFSELPVCIICTFFSRGSLNLTFSSRACIST